MDILEILNIRTIHLFKEIYLRDFCSQKVNSLLSFSWNAFFISFIGLSLLFKEVA